MKKLFWLMNMMFICAGVPASLHAQEANSGITVPVTATGGVIATNRTRQDDPDAASLSAGFRALIRPQVKLTDRFYVYSALQVHSEPFFYQDRYSTDRKVDSKWIQGFLGYTRLSENASFSVKAGKLASAFGAYPLRYDDAVNPLLDQPLSYQSIKIRPDQLPCGVHDFKREPEPDIDFHCGGTDEESYGTSPVTLYGIPGIQFEASWKKLDGRMQWTNSSPLYPVSLREEGQHLQWTAGGGYTIIQGLRVGMSAYRGPWLEEDVEPYLGTAQISDFQASAIGVEAQWAGGPWSANGEWQRFVFPYPGFRIQPESRFGYAEVKRILDPRWFATARINFQQNNRPQDMVETAGDPFIPNRQAYEVAVGFRVNRHHSLKLGYERTYTQGEPATRDNVLGIQFVSVLNALSKAFR